MKHFKYIALFIIVLAGTYSVNAQHIVPSSGIFHSQNSASVSFIIGNLITTNNAGIKNNLIPAMQQGKLTVTTIQPFEEIDFGISVYPNPADDFVFLRKKGSDISGLYYLLYDINGTLLQKADLESNETLISFSALSSSSYLIKVMNGKKELAVFRIIKN